MNEANPIRVLIVDDHAMMRDALSTFLSTFDDVEVCGTAGGFEEALEKVSASQPDVALIDISLRCGRESGIDLIRQIKTRHAAVKTIAHSLYDESLYGVRAIEAGAKGYVSKLDSQLKLVGAIREVQLGIPHFCDQ